MDEVSQEQLLGMKTNYGFKHPGGPIGLTCPRCEAEPGEPCWNISEDIAMPNNHFHKSRAVAAGFFMVVQ